VGLIGVIAVYFTTALTFGIATTTFVTVTPQHVRGQVVALYLMVGNLVGLGLGPPSVGVLMDRGGPLFADIGQALALCCLLTGVPGLILLRRALPRFAAVSDGNRHNG
jgi:MFS family permease